MAEGVRVVEGRTVLSLRLLSQATSGALSWDAASGTAHLDTRGTVPAQADYDEEDLYWMSRIISAESGESLCWGRSPWAMWYLTGWRTSSSPTR